MVQFDRFVTWQHLDRVFREKYVVGKEWQFDYFLGGEKFGDQRVDFPADAILVVHEVAKDLATWRSLGLSNCQFRDFCE